MVYFRILVLWLAMLVPFGARAEVASFSVALRLAEQAVAAGRNKAGISAARQAYFVATDRIERVRAARLLASGYFAAGRLGLAEWWLRRALQDAPDQQTQAALAREVFEVREQNPLRVNLRFSVAPSSNINNGFTGDRVLIWGMPFVLAPDAQAFSGLEISGAGALSHRLRHDATSITELGVFVFGHTYVMSRKSRKYAVGLRGDDFAFGGVGFSLQHRRKFQRFSGPTEFRFNVGQTWYGHAAYDRTIRGAVSQDFRIRPRTIISGFGSLEYRDLLSSGSSVQALSVGVHAKHRLDGGDLLDLLFVVRNSGSRNPLADYSALRGQVDYSLANPVFGAGLSFTAGVAGRDYPLTIYGANGRRDLLLNAGIIVKIPQISAYGFSPVTILEYRQTISNIPLYKRRSIAFRFGVQSSF